MPITKNAFVYFCKMYEEINEFEFEEEELVETDHGYKYAALFRDEYNYKIGFDIYLQDGRIIWEEPEFNEDEAYDTKPFFHSLINEIYQNFKDGNPQPWSL